MPTSYSLENISTAVSPWLGSSCQRLSCGRVVQHTYCSLGYARGCMSEYISTDTIRYGMPSDQTPLSTCCVQVLQHTFVGGWTPSLPLRSLSTLLYRQCEQLGSNLAAFFHGFPAVPAGDEFPVWSHFFFFSAHHAARRAASKSYVVDSTAVAVGGEYVSTPED